MENHFHWVSNTQIPLIAATSNVIFRKFYWRSGNYIKTLLIMLHFCITHTLQLLPHANNHFVEDLHKMLQHLSDPFIYEACNTIIFQRHLQIRYLPPVSDHSTCIEWQWTKTAHENRLIPWTDHHHGRKRSSKLQASLERVLLEQKTIQYKSNLFPCKSQKYVGMRNVWIKWISFKMFKIKRWNWGTLLTSKKNC